MAAIVLGISASLRNARYGIGNEAMVGDLAEIDSKEALQEYLRKQTQLRFEDFVVAGRGEKLPFDKIYSQLRRLRGERGLSNSEAASAAALWGARREGAIIKHLSLAHHFPMSGKPCDLEELRRALLEADAIIVSSPVYFGDRGSLAQSLIDFIAADNDLRSACAGKIYAGLAVGAKRNGGQETTLIYQMLDMVNLDFLAVGNSSETTSQYGGTSVAGDVGTLHGDREGIETCIGTGQRAARVAQLMARGNDSGATLRDRLKLQLWLLQDNLDGDGRRHFESWASDLEKSTDGLVDARVIDIARSQVVRCIACDICPIDTGPRDEYRCIIKTPGDFFAEHHKNLIEADAVLLCAFSPNDRQRTISVYQQFIERTRYLRRDNYVFSDLMMAPFVISELSARQNLHLRMLTSAVRHHTVLHHPFICMMHEGEMLGRAATLERGLAFVRQASRLTVGRYLAGSAAQVTYNPKGYEISAQKTIEDKASGSMAASIEVNAAARQEDARRRLTMAD